MRLVFAVFILSLPVVLMVPTGGTGGEGGVQENEPSLKSAIFSVLKSMQPMLQPLEPFHKPALCGACRIVTLMLQHYVKHNMSQGVMVAFLRMTCKLFRVSTAKVCDGVINNFKGEFFYVLSQSTLTPAQICGTLFPRTCESDQAVNWTVPIRTKKETPPKPYPAPQEGAPTLTVLHISDTHVDSLYQEGSISTCKEPLCCQNGSTPGSKQELAGHWGSFQYCDIPMTTLDVMLKNIRCGPLKVREGLL